MQILIFQLLESIPPHLGFLDTLIILVLNTGLINTTAASFSPSYQEVVKERL